jgi:carbon-monoxide dehydrogenase medium subunit
VQALKYQRATTIDQAVQLLADSGPAGHVLAGGTDIIVQARARSVDVDLLVDVKGIPELSQLAYDAATGLTIGAALPCYRIYADADVQQHYPALVDSTSLIGGTAIQGRASIGGNLCNASPSADAIPTMIVLEGTATIAGPNGARDVPVEDFCTGPGQSVLQPGEVLVSIHFPPPAADSGARFLRFIPRNEMDIAVVNSASALRFDGDTVSWARVAVGAAAPTPLLVAAAADALVGQPLTDDSIAAAATAAREATSPIDDMRGTIKQRRHLAAVLTERTLRGAAERAGR